MEINKLYFIKDEYFELFRCSDNKPNKKADANGEHNRPCYYSFKENDIYWMIPVSSQCNKYEKIYNNKLEKYGFCDTIAFGYIKGNKNVFLLQNMIPVTAKYINNIYVFHDTREVVEISKKTKKELNAKARKILRLSRMGRKLTFTPILDFEKRLLEEFKNETAYANEAAATKELETE